MAKVIVIPSPLMLETLRVGTAAARAGVGAATPATILVERRATLQVFVESVVQPAGAALGVARARGTTASSVVGAGYVVLEALGAIVIDEELIDRPALESGLGVRVLDNVEVALVAPVTVSAMAAVPTPWHLGHVGAPAAHAAGWTGKGVLVGVLDTGIDATHPEFKGKTIQFAEFDTDGLRIPGPARDAGSHGTHVCALVAGRSVGVAPDASLAVAAVLTGLNAYGQNVGRLAQITSGLNWLLTTMFRGGGGDPGVDIVNASLGGVGMNDYLYAPLLTARSAPGTLMVAAIGNAGTLGAGHHGSPGNYDIVIGVGATDSSDVLAAFSDWGQAKQPSGKVVGKPDLVAPGVGVWSAFPGGGYVADDGTSMASPIVCGAAALALQRQPALSTGVAQLQARIESLTVALADPRAGRGRLDLGGL